MRRHLALSSVILSLACAGEPGRTLRDPVTLFAGLQSYESPSQSRARLHNAEWTFRVLRSHLPSDSRPKYEVQVAELKWRECDQEGTLALTFVNGRLSTTTFSPADIDGCMKSLRAQGLFESSPLGTERRRIYTGEFKLQPFIAAADTRLEAEVDRWLSRYA